MNIKDIQKQISLGTKQFNITKLKIQKMIEQGEENAKKINTICDDLLLYIKNNIIYDDRIILSKINDIKKIVGGFNE